MAEAKSGRTLALPFHARLAVDDQAFVADTLRSALTSSAGRTRSGGEHEGDRARMAGDGAINAAQDLWNESSSSAARGLEDPERP